MQMSLVHCSISQDVQSADKTASWPMSGERSTALEGIFGLECVEFATVLVACKDGNEVGGRRPRETHVVPGTMLAFYVSGAQNCIFGTKKVACSLGCQLCLSLNSWHSWTSDGSRRAYCMLLHAEVACVVSEHSGGERFSDRNVLWVQQQLGIWKGT